VPVRRVIVAVSLVASVVISLDSLFSLPLLLRRISHIQEGYDDCDVVDHALLSSPPVYRLLHEEVDCTFGIFILIVAVDDNRHDLVVAEAIP